MKGTCKYCGKTDDYLNFTQFGGHVGNCYLNPKRKIFNVHQKIEVKKYKFNCLKCDKEYELNLKITYFEKGKYTKHCSRECANSRIIDTTETKESTCIKCNDKIIIKKHASTKTSLCENCKEKKPIKVKKINRCNDCNNVIVESKRVKYCIVCRASHIKEAGRKGGKISSQLQSKIRRSKNEIYFYKLCTQYFNTVRSNEQIFNGWDADVIIDDIKIAVLWNGKWHYEKITKKHSVKQVQNRDKIKIKEIKKCGYIPYVIKDMGKHNKDFVNKQFNIFLKHINKK